MYNRCSCLVCHCDWSLWLKLVTDCCCSVFALIRVHIKQFYSSFFSNFNEKTTMMNYDLYNQMLTFYTSADWKYPQHICYLDTAKHVNAKSQFPSTPALTESIPSISVIWILPSMWMQSLSFLLHQRWLKVSPAYLWSGSCQACDCKVSVLSNSKAILCWQWNSPPWRQGGACQNQCAQHSEGLSW